ncbi:MAG: glycosyltransferase family protein [Planctomycetota bacterium]|jgi:exonuclease VII small subunit
MTKEDWDFWLRCADHGIWASTIPEYLDWYRRRSTHADDWSNWEEEKSGVGFQQTLRKKYPRLFEGGFPKIQTDWGKPYLARNDLPCENHLAKNKSRLLMILPWLNMAESDKFNLKLIQQLSQRGWEVTIATTIPKESKWLHEFANLTPDIFILHNFLKPVDYPRFLRYLIQSRDSDVVMVSNSEVGYMLLPYLRAYCREPVYLDYCHIEDEDWKNGGYPRFGVGFQDLLDLNIVASQHLKDWMVNRGADSKRVEVCSINVDTEKGSPLPEGRLTGMGERIDELFGLAGRFKDRHPRAEVSKALGLECVTQVLEFLRLSQYADRLCSEDEGAPKPDGREIQLVVDRFEEQQKWLEGQYNNWKHSAEEKERILEELREWIGRLEEGKTWLEQQIISWKNTAEKLKNTSEKRRYMLEQLLDTKWLRLARKLGIVNLYKLRRHR